MPSACPSAALATAAVDVPAADFRAIDRAWAALEQALGGRASIDALGRAVGRAGGETVLAGESLGDRGGPVPDSREFSLAAATDRDAIPRENLYMELWRAGQPVYPALWFDLAMQGTDG